MKYKHIRRRKLTYTGYKVDPKRRTGAIKTRPTHGVLPPAPKRPQAPEPFYNYPLANN